MKKYLLLLLLFALPFQITWGAASVYCQHEEGVLMASHFGHHFHVHRDHSGEKKYPFKKSTDFHLDCSFCHVSHAVFDKSPDLSILLKQADISLSLVDPPLYYTSYISKGLDRPDWRFAS